MDFRIFLLVLAYVSTVPATDIYLPSLPGMARHFDVREDIMQNSITFYQIGTIVFSISLGILSEYFNRKKLIIAGLSFFMVGSGLCALGKSFFLFAIGRFLEGSGAIAVPIIGWAMVHDLYTEQQSVKIMAMLGIIFSVVPLVSPSIGGYIDISLGWKWNFILLFLVSALTLVLYIINFDYPSPTKEKAILSTRAILKNYRFILSNRIFLANVSLFAILLCGEWCYLTIIPFYFENVCLFTPEYSGVVISLTASSYILGSIFTPKIVRMVGIKRTLRYGVYICLSGPTILLVVALLGVKVALPIAIAMSIYIFGSAFLWVPTTSSSLKPFTTQKVTASSLRSLLFSGCTAMGSFLGSVLSNYSLLPLALLLLACSVCSYLILRSLHRYENRIALPVLPTTSSSLDIH